MSFDLPFELDIDNVFIENKNIENIREKYLLKFVLGNYEEWYIINEAPEEMDDEKDAKTVNAYSLQYELSDKKIRAYDVVSYNAKQVLLDALSETSWNIGYIDAEFELMYRNFKVDSPKTVLDFIFEIAEKFGALVLWDTKKQNVSFYKFENIGIDRGLKISYGKYLESISSSRKTDGMVTRLYIIGNNNISIESVNPTGTKYIEDFSYFMYPFQMDDDGSIISSSYYMSDELCRSIIKYNKLIEDNKERFKTLRDQLILLQNDLFEREAKLFDLETQLKIIEDEIFVAQTSLQPYSHLVEKKDFKKQEVDDKKQQIQTIENNIKNVNNNINTLRNLLSVENNFTPEQIIERNRFIIEKEWKNDSNNKPEELYKQGIKTFEKMREPQLIVDIDIVNFLEIIEEQRNWDKLNLADVVTIQYDKFNVNVKAKIIEIEYDFEGQGINLKIANIEEILTDKEKFLKDLYKTISTSTSVDMNKYKWDGYNEELNDINDFWNQIYDKVKNEVDMAVNETVIIDRRGITILDPKDPLRFLRASHGCLAITNDGGNTYKHAITSWGIVAERLYGRVIFSERLVASDPDGVLEIRGNKVVITDREGREVMWMGLYENDPVERYGIKLENDYNQIFMDRDFGFKITKRENNKWEDKFYVDTQGSLWAEDLTAYRLKIINSKDEILLSEDSLNIDFTVLENIFLDNVITSVEKITLANQFRSIEQGYNTLITHANKYIDEVYNDRTKSYRDLDVAKQNLISARTELTTKFTALSTYLIPIFADMNETTHIIKDLNSTREEFLNKFKEYHNAALKTRNALEDFLEKSSLQLGRDYNKVVIDAENGITVTRSDERVITRLNATEGLTIDRKYSTDWERVAWLDIDGFLNIRGLKIDYMSGTMTNGITIDAENGIVITRGDGVVKTTLNATDGIKIEKNDERKFYVDTNGVLWAEDLRAKRLILYNDRNELMLDADSNFLDLNKFDEIVGNISADNISAKIFSADIGFINDLTVNRLRTLDRDSEGGVRNYIDIQGNHAKWITGTPTSMTQATVNGKPVWWTDSDRISTTTIEDDGYAPVMIYEYDETVKLDIYFETRDRPDAYPIMRWGAGKIGNPNVMVGHIYKDLDGFNFEYMTNKNVKRSIKMLENYMKFDGLPRGVGYFKSPVVFPNGDILPDTNYTVVIIPNVNPNGYIGEWWITNKTTSGFTIMNSGSATTGFDYVVI